MQKHYDTFQEHRVKDGERLKNLQEMKNILKSFNNKKEEIMEGNEKRDQTENTIDLNPNSTFSNEKKDLENLIVCLADKITELKNEAELLQK